MSSKTAQFSSIIISAFARRKVAIIRVVRTPIPKLLQTDMEVAFIVQNGFLFRFSNEKGTLKECHFSFFTSSNAVNLLVFVKQFF